MVLPISLRFRGSFSPSSRLRQKVRSRCSSFSSCWQRVSDRNGIPLWAIHLVKIALLTNAAATGSPRARGVVLRTCRGRVLGVTGAVEPFHPTLVAGPWPLLAYRQNFNNVRYVRFWIQCYIPTRGIFTHTTSLDEHLAPYWSLILTRCVCYTKPVTTVKSTSQCQSFIKTPGGLTTRVSVVKPVPVKWLRGLWMKTVQKYVPITALGPQIVVVKSGNYCGAIKAHIPV